jgi:hypothetical protein
VSRALIIFAALVVIAALVSHFDTRAQVARVCKAKNIVTRELNARVHAHKADSDGLIHFLEDARDARLSDFKREHQESDRLAAERYQGIIVDVKSKARYKIIPLEKC